MEAEVGHCQLCGVLLESREGDACPSCLLGLGLGPEEDDDDAASMEPYLERLPPDITVLHLLGRGGMGVVYQARQIELDRVVALKILSPQLAELPEFAVRFTREAQLMAKLTHPNIVVVHNFGSSDGFCYLIMEYVPGRSLADVIQDEKLSLDQILSLALKICGALRYAHGQGVIHRDIKPENILIDANGEPKVSDFGLAKLISNASQIPALTLPAQSLGTPYYMAPEQRDDPMRADERVDIYALGVTLYQLLTNELPIGRFPLPSEIIEPSAISERVDEVVLKAMNSKRELRYQSAGEFYEALQNLTKLEPPAASPATALRENINPIAPTKTIFLAFAAGDLETFRERLKRELVNRGYRIVPAMVALPLNAPQAEAVIRSALMAADVAIHPIGAQYGWIPDESERSVVEIQYLLGIDESRRHELPRFIWTPRGVHTNDERMRRFLLNVQRDIEFSPETQRISGTLEDFLEQFLPTLTPAKRAANGSTATMRPREHAPRVYLINDSLDEEAADQVEDYLFDLGFEVTRPLIAGERDQVKEAHQRNLGACDAALIYYGAASRTWVDMQLLDLVNLSQAKPADDTPMQGVLVAPPIDRKKARFRTHIAEVLRFESGFAETALEPFALRVAQTCAKEK